MAIISSRISEAFGRGFPRLSIAASASLALLCLFYTYTASAYLQLRIYPLIDRVTYYTTFNFYIVDEYVDHVIIGALLIVWLALSVRLKMSRAIIGAFAIFFTAIAAINYDPILDGIALAALPAIILLVIYNRQLSRKFLTVVGPTINYLAIIGIITGLVSLAFAISSAAFQSDNNDNLLVIRNYAYEIFLLFSSFSPILILLLITSFPIKLLISYVSKALKRPEKSSSQDARGCINFKVKIAYLALFVFISIMMAVIPHLFTVNTDNQLVGVDTPQYSVWIDKMKNSQNIWDFLDQTFVKHSGGDRPISLILILLFQEAFGSINDDTAHTIEYLPLILGPCLVLVIYLLTRELTASDTTSLFAAFLTAISFHTLIGIYAGFYANWIALIFGYLSFLFLFRFLKAHSIRNLAWYGILLTLTLFSHVYTWSIFAIVMGILLVALMRNWSFYKVSPNRTIRKDMLLLLFVLLGTVAIDMGRMVLTGSSAGIERDLQIGSSRAGVEQFALRWNNLTYTSTVYVGGLFANFIIVGLGLYWLFTSNMKESQNLFIIIFMSVGVLPFLFGDWVIQTRVFYDMPFQIPAALAMSYIGRRTHGALLRILPICIWLVSMSILTVSNFYLILREAGT